METIEAALASHRAWIEKFEARIDSGKPVSFDPAKVRESTSCKLGLWFATPAAVRLMGEKSHQLASSIHDTFHEVGYQAALMSSTEASPEEIRDLVANLRYMSEQLRQLLEIHMRLWIV